MLLDANFDRARAVSVVASGERAVCNARAPDVRRCAAEGIPTCLQREVGSARGERKFGVPSVPRQIKTGPHVPHVDSGRRAWVRGMFCAMRLARLASSKVCGEGSDTSTLGRG